MRDRKAQAVDVTHWRYEMAQMRAHPGIAIEITARLHRVDRMGRLAATKVVRGWGCEMSLVLLPASTSTVRRRRNNH